MNRRIVTLLAAGSAAAFAVALPLSAAPKGTNHNASDTSSSTEDCGSGNSLAIRAPEKLWPPNHKYYTDIYALAEDSDSDSIELVTGGMHDQYDGDTEANGSGHTADDITTNDDEAEITSDDGDAEVVAMESGDGSVQTDWQARAERAGTLKAGRTYTLRATATFSDGECSHSVDFTVPHDMRPSNR